jgi:DNA repair exonuclease SbcCD nuclease subunit
MKIAVMADIHLLERRPKFRTDNTPKTVIDKFIWTLNKATEEECELYCIPGDLFDTWKLQDKFVTTIAEVLFRFKNKLRIIAVAGNHDMRYHMTDIKNTPFGILNAAGLIQIPSYINPIAIGDHLLYGIGWGDEKHLDDITIEGNEILLIHKMITEGKPLWPGQTNWIGGKAFMRKYNFKYIFSGDNHQRFISKIGDRVLINSGSLLRRRKDQQEHVPTLTVLDCAENTVDEYPIPISPAEEVFDTDKISKENRVDEYKNQMEKLIEVIKSKNASVKPLEILQEIIEEQKPYQDVVDHINAIIDFTQGDRK